MGKLLGAILMILQKNDVKAEVENWRLKVSCHRDRLWLWQATNNWDACRYARIFASLE